MARAMEVVTVKDHGSGYSKGHGGGHSKGHGGGHGKAHISGHTGGHGGGYGNQFDRSNFGVRPLGGVGGPEGLFGGLL